MLMEHDDGDDLTSQRGWRKKGHLHHQPSPISETNMSLVQPNLKSLFKTLLHPSLTCHSLTKATAFAKHTHSPHTYTYTRVPHPQHTIPLPPRPIQDPQPPSTSLPTHATPYLPLPQSRPPTNHRAPNLCRPPRHLAISSRTQEKTS